MNFKKRTLSIRNKKMLGRLIFLFFSVFVFQVYAVSFVGQKFVISGPSPHIIPIAQQVYDKGGNIFDIAVAAAFSLSVTHPYFVSLGCGGFAVLKNKNQIRALDFREKAPQKMQSDFYEKNKVSSLVGGTAVGVPGFLAGLQALHKEYGELSWSSLVTPAIKQAEKGFPVSFHWSKATTRTKKKFNIYGKKIFLTKRGDAYLPGDRFKQPRLARALRKVRSRKAQVFYKGDLGRDVVKSVQEDGGILDYEDLENYQVRWLKPVSISFRNYQVHSMPLPSSGGIILSRALKLIERQNLQKELLYSQREFHLLGEIMSRAFLPRLLMGDSERSRQKTSEWISDKALNREHKTISLHKVRHLKPPKESLQTTHLSIMDKNGNAVSMTLTLNGYYGSAFVTKKYGIVLNNQMDDFSTRSQKANLYGLIQGKENRIQGGKRPLSSMTPTIIERNGKTVLVLGGAGGPTIITGVLQTIYRHLVKGLTLDQSLQSPRIHHQFLPRTLFVESKRLSPEVIKGLRARGHKIKYRDYIGQVFAAGLRDQGLIEAAHESRAEGASGGY